MAHLNRKIRIPCGGMDFVVGHASCPTVDARVSSGYSHNDPSSGGSVVTLHYEPKRGYEDLIKTMA